jgi:hypothetical protein
LVAVVLAGLVMLMAAEAPDELPEVWANAGVVTSNATNAMTRRMATGSNLTCKQTFSASAIFDDYRNVNERLLVQLRTAVRLVNDGSGRARCTARGNRPDATRDRESG